MDVNHYSLDFIENVIKNEPNNAEAWRIKGDILFSKSSFYPSLEFFSKSIEIDPNYFEAWCGKGKVSIFLDNTLDAIQCLDKAVSIQKNPEAFRLKSHAISPSKFNQNKIQKEIETALKIEPENIDLLTSQALHFRKYGQKVKSISVFEKILTITPDHIIALISLERFKNPETFDLIKYIFKKFSFEKNNSKEIESLADKFFFNFDFISAHNCYDYLISLKASDQGIFNKLARIHLMENNVKEATRVFSSIIKNDKNDSDSWVRLGEIYRRQNKMLEAIECFDSAIEITPNNAEAWRRKGFTQSLRHENIEEAIKCLEKSLELEPYHPMTLTQKSMYLRRIGDNDGAIFCLNTALEIDSTFVLAWKQKAETFTSLNNLEGTLDCYGQILKIDPEDVITWYNTGVTKAKFCEIQFQTGKLFFEKAKYDQAINCFNKILKFDPSDNESKSLLEQSNTKLIN